MTDRAQSVLKLRPLVPAVGVEFQQERICTEHRAHQQHAAISILNIGRMDDGMQQKALRIYQYMALLALDFLSCIETRRVGDPPFSALLTL